MSAGETVAVIAAADASWLGRWRTLPQYRACEAEGHIWVRGPADGAWALLPATQRFVADSADRLTPVGGRVPTRRCPSGPWLPLTEFLRVRPPAAALPAQHIAPIAWTLLPATGYRPPSILVLPFPMLASWCLQAPSVRLRGLKFALAADGRACVAGELLPPLPGESWCLEGQVAIPAGWVLPAGLTISLSASSLRLGAGDLALLHPDGTAEHLPREAFVELTRAAIRASSPQSAAA